MPQNCDPDSSVTPILELKATTPAVAKPRDETVLPELSSGRRLNHEDIVYEATNSNEALNTSNVDGPVLEAWNNPKGNKARLGATYWSFFVCGANDAAYGALIPYLETYYDLSYIVVSLVFLSPFLGYVLSAGMNNWLHQKIGQRWIGFLCGCCHAVAYLVISQHPPYPALVVAYAIAGFGNGIGDAAWNAWVGNLAKSEELLGFMHAIYGAGGTVSPLIATAMLTRGGLQWHVFYYVLLGMAVIETGALTLSFWPKTARDYLETANAQNESNAGTRTALFKMPYARVSWLSAIFLLGYVGTEVSLGGWVVQFMLRVRDAGSFDAGMTSVGFWLGLTVGRATLGFLTPKLGVKLSLFIFIPVTMGLELIFWLVPQLYVSAVAVALQGFFLGPMFPCVVVAITKLLPRHLHVSTIGFAAAFGGSGAAVLPFAIGAIAQSRGVQVLQPIVLAILGAMLVVWSSLPKIGKKRD